MLKHATAYRVVELLVLAASICIPSAVHAQTPAPAGRSAEIVNIAAEKTKQAEADHERAQQDGKQQPLPPYIAGQQGPSGGHGGSRCLAADVPADWRLAAINVWSGQFIDRIQFSYDVAGEPEPRQPPPCGGPGGQEGRVLLIDRDEAIIRVMGKWRFDPMKTSAAISYLFVQTSKGKYRDYGNGTPPGFFFDYIAPEGTEIAGFVVNSGEYVDAIGIILRKSRNTVQMKLPRRD